MSDREAVEVLLGVTLDRAVPVRAQVWSPDDELGYTVVHASVELSRADAAELAVRAGLAAPAAAAAAAVLLPGGWSVDPAEPPPWWPADPATLDDQAARPLGADGWLVSGYGHGRLWLLATWTAEG